MANLNKVMLIGRLTRDPEIRVFANGGKVAKFGFAVNTRRKNPSTGLWEDEPVFLDVDAFNRGETGKQADLVEQFLRKGHLAFIEGHLVLDQWTSQDGQKKSKLKVVLDNVQFLQPRADSQGIASGQGASPAFRSPEPVSPMSSDSFDQPEPSLEPPPPGHSDESIPF